MDLLSGIALFVSGLSIGIWLGLLIGFRPIVQKQSGGFPAGGAMRRINSETRKETGEIPAHLQTRIGDPME